MNHLQMGNALYSNLDADYEWIDKQTQYWTGIGNLFDFRIWYLYDAPVYTHETASKYPVIYYGTFWYQHLPESSYKSNLNANWNWLANIIFIVALPLTLFIISGIGIFIKKIIVK